MFIWSEDIDFFMACCCAIKGCGFVQDLFPPLFALVAASAEVSAARGAHAQPGMARMRLQRSVAGLVSMDSAGSQVHYALMWAAGHALSSVKG